MGSRGAHSRSPSTERRCASAPDTELEHVGARLLPGAAGRHDVEPDDQRGADVDARLGHQREADGADLVGVEAEEVVDVVHHEPRVAADQHVVGAVLLDDLHLRGQPQGRLQRLHLAACHLEAVDGRLAAHQAHRATRAHAAQHWALRGHERCGGSGVASSDTTTEGGSDKRHRHGLARHGCLLPPSRGSREFNVPPEGAHRGDESRAPWWIFVFNH
jgi:hypothetical protein